MKEKAKDKVVEQEVLKEERGSRHEAKRPKETSVHSRLFETILLLSISNVKFIKRFRFEAGFEVSHVTYPGQSTYSYSVS